MKKKNDLFNKVFVCENFVLIRTQDHYGTILKSFNYVFVLALSWISRILKAGFYCR